MDKELPVESIYDLTIYLENDKQICNILFLCQNWRWDREWLLWIIFKGQTEIQNDTIQERQETKLRIPGCVQAFMAFGWVI